MERIASIRLSVHPPVCPTNNGMRDAGMPWGAAAKADAGGAVYGVRRI